MEPRATPAPIIRKSPKKTIPLAIGTEPVPAKRGYLCISRTIREPTNSLFIGDVEVVILEVRGGQVKLGISAPKSTRIERKERLMKAK